MWVARVLLPFFNLLHHAYDTNSWYSFPPGLGQYRLDSASLHYFPRLALQQVSRHLGQSDISNGTSVGMYHIAAYRHSFLLSGCMLSAWLGSSKLGSNPLTFGFLGRALFLLFHAWNKGSAHSSIVTGTLYCVCEVALVLQLCWPICYQPNTSWIWESYLKFLLQALTLPKKVVLLFIVPCGGCHSLTTTC